jgi:hypothetical protein
MMHYEPYMYLGNIACDWKAVTNPNPTLSHDIHVHAQYRYDLYLSNMMAINFQNCTTSIQPCIEQLRIPR